MRSITERQQFWNRKAKSWNIHEDFGDNLDWFSSYVRKGLSQIRPLLNDRPKILDLGTGANNRLYFEGMVEDVFVSADISPEMLRLNGGDNKVVVDAEERLPFGDGSFDLVTSFFLMRYIKRQSELVEEAIRILRPGGIFYFVDLYTNAYDHQLSCFDPLEIAIDLKMKRGICVQTHDDGLASFNGYFFLGSIYGGNIKTKIEWGIRSRPKPTEIMPF